MQFEGSETGIGGQTPTPKVYFDQATFQSALLLVLASRDETMLKTLMTENFFSGSWRGEMGEIPQAEALRALYQEQLGNPIRITLVSKVDLSALLGGIDPLTIPGPQVNAIDTLLVSGWGKDGQDEAILYISRQPDQSLRWAGTLVAKGGFTSPETGGVQPLVNYRHGYQMDLPLGYEVQQPLPNEIMILAPQGTAGEPLRAEIDVELANGRTAEQMAAELKAGLPPHFNDQSITILTLDHEKAAVLDKVPGQDLMRVLFVVHQNLLYRMNFLPQDETQGEAYNQARDLYAVISNTFKFIPAENAGPAHPSGGKLVADVNVFTNLLQQGLLERNKVALQSLMGDSFSLATWQGEEMQITPGEAIQQILNNLAPLGTQPALDLNHEILAKLFPALPKDSAGEDLIPVYVSGWGAEGKAEAILFIARRANGSLYWQGVLTAQAGFAP